MKKCLSKMFVCALIGAMVSIVTISGVSAQGKVLEGFVITSKKDTIPGFIRYESWLSSPASINFSKNRDGKFETLSATKTYGFLLPSIQEKYVSKKIGLLIIDPGETYKYAPSTQAKDSATLFLQEITSGPKAALFEFIDETEREHYFLEKDGKLTELLSFQFHRYIDGRDYIIVNDEYKNQITKLLYDGSNTAKPVSSYSSKELGRYVDLYNQSFGYTSNNKETSTESNILFDVQLMGGMEGWNETGVNLKSTHTFGAGVRLSLPRNFHNRYFRFMFSVIPGVTSREVFNSFYKDKMNLKTMEFGIGSYFGSGNIRPNFGIDYSFALDNWRSGIIGPHIGISYKWQVNLEIGHFANIATVISETGFFNKPRISLSYYLNLNQLFTGKNQ